MKHTLEVKLKGGAKGDLSCYFEVPFSVEKVYGTRGRVPVKVTIGGLCYRSSMSPMGGCHLVPVRRERAEQAGVRAGQKVRVILEKDTAPRIVRPPAELAAALKKDAIARAGWQGCSYTHKKEHADSIREAKAAETRARRVKQAVAALKALGTRR